MSWPSPPLEWVAFYSDGSDIPETRRAVVGGLFRDVDGRCLAAYSMNLGILLNHQCRIEISCDRIANGLEEKVGEYGCSWIRKLRSSSC
ncbi:hypothetical protein LINGRAHAP2_LOCUS17702 [Linum grandiflorum]